MKFKVNQLSRHALVYLVTGNSFTKAIDMLDGCEFEGVFCNSGDELRARSGRLLWRDTETPPLHPAIETALLSFCDQPHNGNRIEWRSPRALNFCKIGRNSTHEQRLTADVSWRANVAEIIRRLFKVDVAIGGSVSIDIYSHGADKARAARYVNDVMDRDFVFVGDKTAVGGNDYPIAVYCAGHPANLCLTTNGTKNTLDLIDGFLGRI